MAAAGTVVPAAASSARPVKADLLRAQGAAPRQALPRGKAVLTLHGDFNGDGYADAAAGVDLKDVHGQADAGAVSVIYGTASGLAAAGSQLWTQDSPGVLDQAEPVDSFGRYMGGGDFNGDGYFDLAVGVPEETVDGPSGPIAHAGAVQILYGSATGLTAVGNQFWTQLGLNPADTAEEEDWFGSRMQGADFNGDGYDDLAASAMVEDVGDITNAGSVNVLYGSPTGLIADGNQYWTQDSPGILDEAAHGDLMGRGMGSGDFNADGYQDLAIGAPHNDVGLATKAGVVNVIYGSALGLTADGNQLWSQDSPGILEEAQTEDWFGRTGIAGGDFNGDGIDDLAIGVLQDDVDGVRLAGVVNVIYGSSAGLTDVGNQLFSENTPGSVSDGAEFGDRFGRTVEAADANGDGYIDLSIGISHEGILQIPGAGAMVMLYGSAAGLSEDGNQFWHQDSPGILEQCEAQDNFDGRVPDFGDMNGDGYADIAVGVFKEDLEGNTTIADAGGMNVIYGSGAGLTSVGNQFWSLASPGVKGTPAERDAFGQSNVG